MCNWVTRLVKSSLDRNNRHPYGSLSNVLKMCSGGQQPGQQWWKGVGGDDGGVVHLEATRH